MEWKEIIKMFSFGIVLGYGPCLLVCLPILIPYITAKGTDSKTGLKLTVIFSLSKVIAYSLLGILSVVAFKVVSSLSGSNGEWIRLIVGVFVVLIGLTYLLGKNLHVSCKLLHKYLIEKSNWNMFVLGLLVGFLPCPPLMGVLAYLACSAPNVLWGFIGGFSFGLGTLISPLIPAGVIAGSVSYKIKESARMFMIIRVVCSFILIYFGMHLIIAFKTFYF